MPERLKIPKRSNRDEKSVLIAQSKEKILKVILEHGELTKNEIALETGLMRHYGPWEGTEGPMDELIKEKLIEYCKNKNCEKRRIDRELKRTRELKKLPPNTQNVKSKFGPQKKRGPKPKVWIIKRDIFTIYTIFNSYPQLQETLWKCEWIRDLIVKKQLDIKQLNEEEIIELKEMLMQSAHFFKLCVNYNDLRERTLEWQGYLNPLPTELSTMEIAKRLTGSPDRSYITINSYRNLFAFCYFMDEFDGKEEESGYAIVEKFTHQRSQKIIETRQNEILSALDRVLIPVMKIFFDNINDESFSKIYKTNPKELEKIRLHIQEYTTLSNRMKRNKNSPDGEEKYLHDYESKRAIFLEILDVLKEMGIIKRSIV